MTLPAPQTRQIIEVEIQGWINTREQFRIKHEVGVIIREKPEQLELYKRQMESATLAIEHLQAMLNALDNGKA